METVTASLVPSNSAMPTPPSYRVMRLLLAIRSSFNFFQLSSIDFFCSPRTLLQASTGRQVSEEAARLPRRRPLSLQQLHPTRRAPIPLEPHRARTPRPLPTLCLAGGSSCRGEQLCQGSTCSSKDPPPKSQSSGRPCHQEAYQTKSSPNIAEDSMDR